MRKQRTYYKISNGTAYYIFSCEEQMDGTWRAYIVAQPSYHDRPKCLHLTHRVFDGRFYIDTPLIAKMLDECKIAAIYWATQTQRYIGGYPFERFGSSRPKTMIQLNNTFRTVKQRIFTIFSKGDNL